MLELFISARLSGRSFAARCLLTVTTTGGFSLVHLGGCTGAAASSICPQKCCFVSGKSNSLRLASSAPSVCGRSVYLGKVRFGSVCLGKVRVGAMGQLEQWGNWGNGAKSAPCEDEAEHRADCLVE